MGLWKRLPECGKKVGSRKTRGRRSGTGVHSERAVAEIENALGLVCDKLGNEAVEAVAQINHTAGASLRLRLRRARDAPILQLMRGEKRAMF